MSVPREGQRAWKLWIGCGWEGCGTCVRVGARAVCARACVSVWTLSSARYDAPTCWPRSAHTVAAAARLVGGFTVCGSSRRVLQGGFFSTLLQYARPHPPRSDDGHVAKKTTSSPPPPLLRAIRQAYAKFSFCVFPRTLATRRLRRDRHIL